MITYYARLSRPQLDELQSTPDAFSRIHERIPPGAEIIDLDKASGVIAWLLSPCKRAEQIQFAALVNEDLDDNQMEPPDLPPVLPLDDFAIAIEGRGAKKIAKLDIGYGPACAFEPAEVKRFSDLLATVNASVLRRELNFKLMDTLHLPVEYWEEAGEETFTQYIVPQFEKLKRFYLEATKAGQLVLVWYN